MDICFQRWEDFVTIQVREGASFRLTSVVTQAHVCYLQHASHAVNQFVRSWHLRRFLCRALAAFKLQLIIQQRAEWAARVAQRHISHKLLARYFSCLIFLVERKRAMSSLRIPSHKGPRNASASVAAGMSNPGRPRAHSLDSVLPKLSKAGMY